MRRLLMILLPLLAAAPVEAQRICKQVGQSVRCSDGTYLPKAQPRTPPKDGTFEYHSNGTVCQVFGKNRYCR